MHWNNLQSNHNVLENFSALHSAYSSIDYVLHIQILFVVNGKVVHIREKPSVYTYAA